MSVWVRIVLTAWPDPPLAALAERCAAEGFVLRNVDGRGWAEWEIERPPGSSVVQGDVTFGAGVEEEAEELLEFLEDLEGPGDARERVRAQFEQATAIAGMRISLDDEEAALEAADLVHELLAEHGSALLQSDVDGWFAPGVDEPLLAEPA